MTAFTKNRTWGSKRSFSQITRKLKQISKFSWILGCSARQDLSAVQFSWRFGSDVGVIALLMPFLNFQLWHLITWQRKQLSKFRQSWVIRYDKTYLLCNFRENPWNDVGVIALLMLFFSSPGRRPCELLASLGVRRPSSSSVVCKLFQKFSSQKLQMLQTWNFRAINYRVSRL